MELQKSTLKLVKMLSVKNNFPTSFFALLFFCENFECHARYFLTLEGIKWCLSFKSELLFCGDS